MPRDNDDTVDSLKRELERLKLEEKKLELYSDINETRYRISSYQNSKQHGIGNAVDSTAVADPTHEFSEFVNPAQVTSPHSFTGHSCFI